MPNAADSLYLQLLVVRCQVGDRAALEEVIALCQPRLRAFLHKMLPDSHLADDAAQDVWMDVYRDLPRLANPAAFLPWLYRIAHNRAFRVLRRRPDVMASMDQMEIAGQEPPDFSAEDAQAVHAALEQLSPEHRESLILRFMEEMSYEQIAAVAGCPVGTIRSRIHNAKIQLRDILERQMKYESR